MYLQDGAIWHPRCGPSPDGKVDESISFDLDNNKRDIIIDTQVRYFEYYHFNQYKNQHTLACFWFFSQKLVCIYFWCELSFKPKIILVLRTKFFYYNLFLAFCCVKKNVFAKNFLGHADVYPLFLKLG